MLLNYTDMNGNDAFCHIERHNHLIIATELAENTGASVTNSCEKIAAKCCSDFNISTTELVLIERYDHRSYIPKQTPNLSRVSFGGLPESFTTPSWEHITEELLEDLIDRQQ